ncbi:flocculation protein FLO11 isoform X1 [Nasonia vitripennis]|uniref:Chitin-binding type-2 domain-containing protein n=2 Tax=Nasonia vitripennis TaxID=7425 RepID=A0A7M7QY93_NASVI|nr:flocculation protein FLO11 isoform X1 [Nasonia vitripennis]
MFHKLRAGVPIATMIFKFFLLLCVAATFVPGHCEEKTSSDEERSRLPEFLSELDVASAEASVEDVEALRKIVKRLAPEKNGEYMIQVFFGNKDLLRNWLKQGAEITGQPGVDYPALTTIPATSFSCRGQKGGYYADPETNCQVFHICDNSRKISFLCPNGTIFQQSQLICDWWFKVDCSKSAELYEQSAELLAEEERKRIENKKMNSEFHRSNNDDNSNSYYQSSNYDGRQNGRSNPYGSSASQNQLPDGQNTKTTQAFDPNQIYERQTTRSQSQPTHSSRYTQDTTVTRAKDDYNKPQNNRQQNQLLSNDGKSNQNYDQRGSNKYYNNNQVKSSQEDEYYGSAANVNAQREDKQSVKQQQQSNKPRSFTRQNFNAPVQKVTPTYMETTTFRTSTASPIREFQHLAESAAFASTRGNNNNRHKPHSSNQFNSFYSNTKAPTATTDNFQQSTAPTTVVTQKDRSSPHTFVRSRVSIPAFPGPTFTPIYKPRTTTLPPQEESTTTQRPYTNTDYYRQGSQEQSTTYRNYETTTMYPDYTTTDSQFTYSTTNYRDRNTNPTQTTFNNDRYTTIPPTTQRTYFTRDFYRETTTPAVTTTTNYDSSEYTTRFTDNYSGSFTTIRPVVYNDAFSQNTVSSNTVDDNGPTTPAVTFVEDIQAQDSARFGSPKFSTQSGAKSQSQSFRQNHINPSTEKSNRANFDSSIPRRTPSPYDTSVTYQHGKIMSTLGPYVPFTKNYAFTTTTTTPRSFDYTSVSSGFNQVSKNRISKPSPQNYVQSNFGKSGNRATYLPEKTTPPTFISETNALDNRPQNEREHALSMLKSLQGLEGSVPNLNLNNINNSRSGLDIPSSSGPSTLHSLALYFANADDDDEGPTDSAIDIQYFETTANPIEKKNTSVIELPSSILTQHTISSYAELFNLNNALENNITGDTSYDNSDENLTDEDTSDLDIQQSEGPLNGVKKSNNTKLRELAQVFTQALSAYLQDPDTFKKVLTEIRPTEPPQSENEIQTTASPTTTEDYPSVTKEKDEVLDFSDDNNGVRRRRPTTTPLPETAKETTETVRETTYQPFYTPEYFSTTTQYPDESLNEAQSGYINQPNDQKTNNKFAYRVNNVFDSKKLNEVENYKSTTYSVSSSSNTGKDYESYFPNEPSRYGGFQNNSANTQAPYGKYVKPSDATPISDNYVASSTPATYEVAAPQNFAPSKPSASVNDNLRDDLTPPAQPNYQTSNTINAISSSTRSNTKSQSSSVTPVYKRPQESVTTTKEPFRIRYYDTTTPRQQQQQHQSENLVTASSVHSSFGNNFNNLDNGFRQTEKPANNQRFTNNPTNHHWTSSPTVTQLWETTVFIDPDHINRGLDNDPKITQSSNIDSRSTTPSSKDDFFKNEASNAVTPQNFITDPSTPWQWASNNNDSPTAFTLLPNIYANTENTATPTPTYTTRSSITTTITSSITATNAIPPRDHGIPTRISVYNVTENEIQKAHQMFGNLNETSTNTLMKVMKQADNNATVRQLVLLLISHCNGPMNKTMEEEKEQLLNALLKMPVNEFTSEESRELIRGISKLHLPLGRSTVSDTVKPSTVSAETPTTTVTPAPSEPSVTTFRSRSGRKFKTTTVKSNPSYSKVTSNNAIARSDRVAPAQLRNAVSSLDEGTASDNRALDLLRSLYTIAAKWG